MKNTYKWLFVSLALLCTVNTYAQNSFRYQAVARDSSGDAISNQLIGVQISIILDDIANSPIYQEMHQPTSNDYGVLNLNVGDGIPLVGDFASINWSQTSFIKVELDITGGTNYTVESTSQILSVPHALYAERAGSVTNGNFGLNVKDFGATGDGVADDYQEFKAVLDSAEKTGAKVLVPAGTYRLSKTLILRDGVTLLGEGMGSDPLQTPFNGSLLLYEGNGYGIKVEGHNAGVRDIVVRDNSNGSANGGISVTANGRLVENVNLSNVLISNFIGGTGLRLFAKNAGGIAYAAFNNVRVRNAKKGIQINDDSNGSFVNSNNFYNCVISGGGFTHGLLIQAGNNNTFYSTVIEPPSTTKGHIVVTNGEIVGQEIRVEGNKQAAGVPLILFNAATKNSTLTGIYAGGLTLDKGNNFINMSSGKAIHFKNDNHNRFRNSIFSSCAMNELHCWDVTGTGVNIEVLVPELTEKHNVIKLTIPAGVTATINPDSEANPKRGSLKLFNQVNFGFYVKTNQANKVFATTNAPLGQTNSTPHTGSNNWEFVGMQAEVNQTTTPFYRLQIENTTGANMIVFVTTPTLSFGNQLPTLEPEPLSANGGIIDGQLSNAFISTSVPVGGFLSLPLTANYYEILNVETINRINHTVADRTHKGTVVTLLFNNAGVNVTNSAYIILKSGFTAIENGSLTLISNGDGTWREVDRNN
jgi:hypothetical protein